MVGVLGEKMFSSAESLKRTIWGSVLLTLACALPFVGWFLLFPYVALTGFGAVILSFFQREARVVE
jgi:sorbitol-specific phosphotransferase system component IIBC